MHLYIGEKVLRYINHFFFYPEMMIDYYNISNFQKRRQQSMIYDSDNQQQQQQMINKDQLNEFPLNRIEHNAKNLIY